MLDRETKTKNTIIGRLMALFVTGIVCLSQAIPVFADEQYTHIDFTTTSVRIYADPTTYFTEGQYDDVVVPVYISIDYNTNPYYISGFFNASYSAFNFVDGNNNRWAVSYFENINTSINARYNRANTNFNITFDNAYMRMNIPVLIGYFHLASNYTGNTLTITCNNATQTMTIGSNNVYASVAPFGYVQAMIYALNNSANVEDMLSILNNIDVNMLPEILTVMRNNHTALYNLIQNVWTTDQSILSVNQNTYNAVLSILAILEDAYAPQASQAEDIKEDVEQNLSNLISDIELTKPSQVANIADDYISQIDTSYNNLAFGFLSNNTIVLMLCIVAGLAIISYMLYGGQ